MSKGLGHRFFIIILLLSINVVAAAQAEWEYFFDSSNAKVEQINTRSENDGTVDQIFNFGFYEHAVWLRQKLAPHEEPVFIFLNNPTIMEIDFYILENGVLVKKTNTGASRPVETREFKYSKFLFEIPRSSENQIVLLRLKTNASLFGTVKTLNRTNYISEITNDQSVSFVVNGILFSLTVIYLIIFITLRERIYLYYLLYVFCIGVSIARFNGSLSLFPGLDFSGLYNYQSVIEAGVSVTAGIFAIYFLRLKKYAPFFFKFLWLLVIFQACFFFLGFFNNQLTTQLVQSVASLYILVMTPLAIYIYAKKRYVPALYFLISWLLLFVGSMVYILVNAGMIQSGGLLVAHSLEIGVALEMIFLSLGVSKRIDDIVRSNLKIKADNIEILSNQKLTLEQLVSEKTAQLANQNSELQDKIKELEQTQTQLLKSEKMASLGTLSAGIAHEINNPLNFISGSLQNLRQQVKRDELVNKLISYMDEGVKRINRIVKSLGMLSQKDEQMRTICDVHKILNNCLSIINLELHVGIHVTKEFSLKHTVLFGDPASLHLAFMNILTNALQSIEDKHGEVTIRTREENDEMYITISDTGNGIKSVDFPRIGDPFYTTKDPGKGVGLGLYLTYNIINDHNGRVDFISEEGIGSTFSIHFPIVADEVASPAG